MTTRGHRHSAVRRIAMASAAIVALTLPASTALTSATTRTPDSAGTQADSGLAAGELTSASAPATLPARGPGAADSTAADPAAAGEPNAASVTTGPGAIPATALAAYRKAAATLAVSAPGCHLTWPLLAAIGKVETDHGRSWGADSRITAAGEVIPTILGPVLDGKNGTAKLLDTDGGVWDEDRQYDRAVGPMQFVPGTWREFGRDGNGDGVADPNNIWDATLTTADYLCGGGRNLADPVQLRAAILAYNPSTDYLRAVLAWARAYEKAASKLPALAGVPDPLVLGAGGVAGDDPFGDSSVFDESGGDDGSFDDSNGGSGVPSPIDDSGGFTLAQGLPAGISSPNSPAPATHSAPVRRTRVPTGSANPAPPALHRPAPPAPTGSGGGSTPVPPPKPTPKPTPTPTPKPPVCVDTGITVLPTVAATATPVDTNADGKDDALHVTAAVSVPKSGSYTIGVRLLDDHGWRITSTVTTVVLAAGHQQLAANLAGTDIGDAGASGPATLRITTRAANAPVTCAKPLLPAASAGTIDASAYDSWVTSLTRLRQRLTTDISTGQVSGAAATELPAALNSPSAAAPNLTAFRSDLVSAKVVSPQEEARLDSLAGRLIAQASAGVASSTTTTPYTDDVDPSADGVG